MITTGLNAASRAVFEAVQRDWLEDDPAAIVEDWSEAAGQAVVRELAAQLRRESRANYGHDAGDPLTEALLQAGLAAVQWIAVAGRLLYWAENFAQRCSGK